MQKMILSVTTDKFILCCIQSLPNMSMDKYHKATTFLYKLTESNGTTTFIWTYYIYPQK